MSSLGIFDKETKTYKKVADLSKTAVIDASMSDTSTNAVQNKVVKSYVDGRTSSVAWNNVTGKPSTYPPSSHTHTKSQITDFPSSLPANGGNASTVNGHTVKSDVPENAKFTDTTYSDATTSTHGLMTPDMVTKLNGIAEGANRTTVDSSMSDTSTNAVQNKAVKSYVDTRTTLDTSMSDSSTKAVQNKVVKRYIDNGVNSSKKLQTYKQGSTTETYGDNYNVYAQLRDGNHVKMKCDNYTVETDYATSAGNASTVNGHTVNSNVPANAKFTDTTYSDATTSVHGLMTPAMVSKLNGIAEGANRTIVDSGMSDTSTNPVQNKAVKSYVDGRTTLDTAMSDNSTKAVQNKVVKSYIDTRTTFDSAMSDTSTNAVQNKIVKSYVDTRTTLDTSMSDSSTKAVQNKVVKRYVDGKFKQKLLAQMNGDGKTSYCQLCTIKISNKYIDTPIEITVQERGRATVDRLTVLFSSADNIDPTLRSFKVFGEFVEWYISKRASSTWVIYGRKSEEWASIKVVDYIGIDGVNVTWDVTGVTALPDSKTKASWGGNVSHANSADSASSVAWNNVTGKPSTYTPSSHTHTKSQITDFPSSLPANGGNSATVNGHTVNSNVPSGAKFTDTTYGDATTSTHGLMTPDMVTKLNGIAAGANKTTVDSSMSDTSANPVQNKAIKKYIDNETNKLKKSVSDGKTKVANAITAKGVKTATDATFDVMAGNISKITTGTKLNLYTQTSEPSKKDGIWVKTSNQYKKAIIDNRILSSGGVWTKPVSDLPTQFLQSPAVVYNGEIHILGGGSQKDHYKWNGSSWTNAGSLPYTFQGGPAVVYNGEIHILGSNNNNYFFNHYKWNGSSWTNAGSLPYQFPYGSAVVYNGEIHILGGGNRNHYKWNGSSWTSVSTLPYTLQSGSAVVYNGEIHILGGNNNSQNHYKWNGSSWTNVSTLPYYFYDGSAVVYNGEIHILGGGNQSQKHCKWNGSSWTNVSTLPYQFKTGSAVVYNGTSIYIIGSGYSSATMKYRAIFTSPANTYDPYTLIIQRGDTNNGVYITAFADMSVIAGSNNRFQTGFDDAWYFGASAFETTPIYYGNGSSWVKFKN